MPDRARAGTFDVDLDIAAASVIVSDEHINDSVAPQIASIAGGSVVVWQSDRETESSNFRIRARVVGRDGWPHDEVIPLAAGRFPTIARLGDKAIITWAASTPAGDVLGYAIVPEPQTAILVPGFIKRNVKTSFKVGVDRGRVNVATCDDDQAIHILEDVLQEQRPSLAHPRDGCEDLAWVATRHGWFLAARRAKSTEVFARFGAGWVSIAFYTTRCVLLDDLDERCVDPPEATLVSTRRSATALLIEDATHPTKRLVATGLDLSLRPQTRSTTVLLTSRLPRFSAVAADDIADGVLMTYLEDGEVKLRELKYVEPGARAAPNFDFTGVRAPM